MTMHYNILFHVIDCLGIQTTEELSECNSRFIREIIAEDIKI